MISLLAVPGTALAGAALDDTGTAPATTTTVAPATSPGGSTGTPTGPTEEPADPEKVVEYGVGIRLRNVRVPESILELFLERAAGGSSNTGVGVELIRRRGNVELQLGLEFEHLQVGEGVWINKGDHVEGGDEADFVLSPDHAPNGDRLGWFTIEFTFMNHAPINKYLAFRYGGGAGLGILTGNLWHYNIICAPGTTNSNPNPGCVPPRFSGSGQYSEGTETPVKYDLPPVAPVVNAIVGLQITPVDKLKINIEAGIRSAPFVGLSSSYFF